MWAGEPVMERELFSASPRAAQMARARLRLALGAFGSSYSSLLATVHLVLSLPSQPPPPRSLSLSLSLSRRKATLASAVKDYPTFSHSTKSSVLTLWPLSHTAPASSCTVQHGPLRSCLLQCFFCSTVMQINPFIYRYVRALEVAECISRDICLRSLETICRVPETLRSVSLSEVKWIFNRGESKINISFLSPPPRLNVLLSLIMPNICHKKKHFVFLFW